MSVTLLPSNTEEKKKLLQGLGYCESCGHHALAHQNYSPLDDRFYLASCLGSNPGSLPCRCRAFNGSNGDK